MNQILRTLASVIYVVTEEGYNMSVLFKQPLV